MTSSLANDALVHLALKIGVRDVEEKYLFLQLEHGADLVVEPIFQATVLCPKTLGALVQDILLYCFLQCGLSGIVDEAV